MNTPGHPPTNGRNPALRSISPAARPSRADAQSRLRRRAVRLATELCDLSPEQWLLCSVGADAPIVTITEEPAVAEVIDQARVLARTRPAPDQVRSQAGAGGLVVVAHGPAWSLVARAGGPVLVLCASYPTGARIDADPSPELGALVADRIAVSRDRPHG